MNAAMVAAALRQLADAIEAPDGLDEAVEEPRPPKKARPRPRSFPLPDGAPLKPISDTERMAARKMLQRRGIV